MPARDFFHETVKNALIKDSWTITHDPYKILIGKRKGYIDLAAEKLIAAERDSQKIVVEVKSFLGVSSLDEFEDALGQFLIYKVALERHEPDRKLFLAVSEVFYEDFFDDSFFVEIAQRYEVHLLIFDDKKEEILQWIN
ncbi:MAG: fatty-acid oxidation protein subunit alpha [Spirosomaceae bacterium]|jgi:hypothetical protein|nr:fatty-acid oxidation protein subunit alpha [Spirosomataceae bacterium]